MFTEVDLVFEYLLQFSCKDTKGFSDEALGSFLGAADSKQNVRKSRHFCGLRHWFDIRREGPLVCDTAFSVLLCSSHQLFVLVCAVKKMLCDDSVQLSYCFD